MPSALYVVDDRGSDMDLMLNGLINIMRYSPCEVLATIMLLCILLDLSTKHKTTCQNEGMDYERYSQGGDYHTISREPKNGSSRSISAVHSNISYSTARTMRRPRRQEPLAVRLFMVFGAIGLSMGQTTSTTTSAVVQVPQGIFVASQALYVGLAAAMGQYKTQWRAKKDQTSVTFAAFAVFAFSTVQIGLLWFSLDRKHDETLNVIHTTGPAPILATVVALWLYPVGYEKARSKYRRPIALWDSDPGSRVRLRKLLNARYKWVVYIAVTAVVWAYGVILFLETDNVYPLLSSVLVPVLSSMIGAIPALSEHIEELQNECTDMCQQDVITIPVIGRSRSTSFILLHFDWKVQRMRIERVHSIIDHSDWGNKGYELLYDVAGEGLMSRAEFTSAAFHKRVKACCKIVRVIGREWHDLSYKTNNMSGEILSALEQCPYVHAGHLRLFLLIRAVLTTTFLTSGSKYGTNFHLKQDSADSVETFIEDLTMGRVKTAFEIVCSDGKALGSDDANALVRKFTDRTDRDMAVMLLLQMAAISGDNRVYVADTLVDGSDVYLDYSFKTKKWSQTILSKNRLLENPNCATSAETGGVYDVFKQPSGQGLSGKSHLESASVDMVPSTLTTFKILRQHMMKYLVGYMALSIIFIAFGESFSK